MIKIYDTKTRTKREFVPVNEGKVGMYVCGPTVYNYIHIGNVSRSTRPLARAGSSICSQMATL